MPAAAIALEEKTFYSKMEVGERLMESLNKHGLVRSKERRKGGLD